MKKLAAALTSTALCATGLIAATGTAANADDPALPELTTTTTHANGSHHGKARVQVTVTADDGSSPEGEVGFTFLNLKKGKTYSFTKSYDGADRYGFKKVEKGSWLVFVDFQPGGDVLEGSADQTKVKVTKKHHRKHHHKHHQKH